MSEPNKPRRVRLIKDTTPLTDVQIAEMEQVYPGFAVWYREKKQFKQPCVAKEQEQGEGLLHIDASVWENIGKPETFDAWHKGLLLPESYAIERVEQQDGFYILHVTHKAIPVVVGASYLPRVMPHYTRHFEDRQKRVSLARVEILLWNKDKGWQTVATTDREEIA